MLSFDDRIDFYLGSKLVAGLKDSNSKKLTFADLDLTQHYMKDLADLLIKTNNTDKEFYFHGGDITGKESIKTLCKNRYTGYTDSVLLRSLNFNRHWQFYYNKLPDIPFSEKEPMIFWRGATTGSPSISANRFDLVTSWFNKHDSIDIAFSIICQKKDIYAAYIKGRVRPSEFLKYKYIISVEGNDKDSGINWKLNSNSLVMMPRPRCCSWLMETTLVPDYHYVLLKDDFSDLAEKLEWCNANQEACLDIIKHANTYMDQFADNAQEEQLEEAVINKYFKLIASV